MKGNSLNLRCPILNYLPTVDMVSHCILWCLPQTWSANLEVFVLPNWTFFMCSDTLTPKVVPFLRSIVFYTHTEVGILHSLWCFGMFLPLASNVETLGVVVFSKLPMVLREREVVHTLHLLRTLLISVSYTHLDVYKRQRLIRAVRTKKC